MAKIGAKQGWAPSAYLKEEMPPPPPPPASLRPTPPPPPGAKTNGVNGNAKPKPPLPPAKRPVRASAASGMPQPRDSSQSLNTDSGRSTPSLAGGLAEALRARQSAMKGKKEEDDDDDW